MADEVNDLAYALRLTPKPILARNASLSVILISVPIFSVLFFLGVRNGTWMFAVVGQALCLILCGLAYMLFSQVFIGVTATTIEERGFWGLRTSFPRSAISSVILARTLSSGSIDTIPQLVVRSATGDRILRMRGVFWTAEAMRAVVGALDVTAVVPAEPMTRREFLRQFPGAAYWFERGRVLTGLVVAGALLGGAAVVLGILHLVGLPLIGGA